MCVYFIIFFFGEMFSLFNIYIYFYILYMYKINFIFLQVFLSALDINDYSSLGVPLTPLFADSSDFSLVGVI